MSKRTERKIVENLYPVNKVSDGFYYYVGMLLDIVVDIFEYEGLPSSLPSEEIEKRLITTGHCAIVKHPYAGIITSDSSLYNYDFYGNYAMINMNNPHPDFRKEGFVGAALRIGKDCEVIYNNSIEKWTYMNKKSVNSFFQLIQRYARMMAEIDSTIYSEMLQQRTPYVVVATTQQNKDSALAVLGAVKSGNTEVALDSDFLKELKALKAKDIIPNALNDLLEVKNTLLKQFLADIGVFSTDDKKERLIVDEVERENQNVKVFIYNMLRGREIGVAKVNQLYDLDIKVSLRSAMYNEDELYEEGDEIDDSEGILTE